MKYLLALLIIISACSTNRHIKEDNKAVLDLQKYTYLLMGRRHHPSSNDSTDSYALGSCFFARHGKEVYLITAKHCINDFNSFNKQPTEAQFDTVGVRFFNTSTKEWDINSLDIFQLKKGLPNDYFYKSPDMVVLHIGDTSQSMFHYINTLESYFYKKSDNDIIDSVLIFGFGFKDTSKVDVSLPPMYYSGTIADNARLSPYYPRNDSLYYITTPVSIQGMSGSPVFLKIHSKTNNEKRIIFGGLTFGADTIYNVAYIINPLLITRKVTDFQKWKSWGR